MLNQTPLQRTLVISVFALICFAGGILTCAVGYFFPTGLTIPIAIAAYLLNEHLRLFRLNQLAANILGVLSFVAAGFEFFSDNPEGKLLAGIYLLCYVQWILLFVDKEAEQYWWHIAISILQVAASAVLTFHAWYGLVVTLFIPVMIWTLAVYIMFLSDQQFRISQGLDLSLASEDVSSSNVVTPQGRWHQAVNFSSSTVRSYQELGQSQSSVTNSIRLNSRKAWITPRFIAGTNGLSLAACLFGVLIFICIPRLWVEGGSSFQNVISNRNTGTARQTLSGFTQEIKLGDVGQILQNPQPVFRVRFTDYAKNQPISAYDYARKFGMEEPLFRGSVLTIYEKGRWKPLPETYGQFERILLWGGGGGRGTGRRRIPNRSFESEHLIRQDYRLEPIGVPTLFSLGPIFALGRDRELNFEMHTESLEIRSDSRDGPRGVQYQIYSLDYLPKGNPAMLEIFSEPKQKFDNRKEFLHFQKDEFPGLIKLTEAIKSAAIASPATGVSTPNVPQVSSEMHIAKALDNYLSNSGKFAYALNVPVINSSIDPIEDFIINRKQGHCEYFASALAIMMRAAGIPSRVINGFKGGTENKNDHSLEVQQRFAHSWVEAFVDGRWRTFDPTPSEARTENLAGTQPDLSKRLQTAAMETWFSYVVNLSSDRQREIFEPLWQSVSRSFAEFDLRDWQNELVAWSVLILLEPWRIFTWLGAAIFVLLLLLIGIAFLAIRFVYLQYRRTTRRQTGASASIQSGVLFFANFLSLMAGRGLKPAYAQTPEEFASSAMNRIEGLSRASKDFGSRIVQAFYQVRFGRQTLSAAQEQDLNDGIAQLRQDLKNSEHGQTTSATEKLSSISQK